MAAGRHIDPAVATDVQEGLLINESAARDLGYADPAKAVGKRFSQRGREGRILGVVRDFNHGSLHRQVQPLSFRLSDWLRFLVLKVGARPGIVEGVQAPSPFIRGALNPVGTSRRPGFIQQDH